MNIETFNLLNNDKLKNNRFNYDLISKCIENINNLSLKGFIILNGINENTNNLLHIIHNYRPIILIDYKINKSYYDNTLNNIYLFEDNILNYKNLPIYDNNHLLNMFSFVYFNKTISLDIIKQEFDFFKHKIVINGIILFDNIDKYPHMECIDSYIKQNNFTIFIRSKNKIAYSKHFHSIKINTISKTGSSSFHHNIKNHFLSIHTHSLEKFKYDLLETNKLFIVGIRNPLDRNISDFFQKHNCDFYNDIEIQSNSYKGEYNYITDSLQNYDINQIINLFFTHKNYINSHYIFNEWFNEFFNIININNLSFDKERGFEFYSLKNNNSLLIYTLEKLNNNINEFKQFFNLNEFKIYNESNTKNYKDLYLDFKKNIKFTEDYKNKLLNTNIMKIFYSNDDINNFYNKYPTKL